MLPSGGRAACQGGDWKQIRGMLFEPGLPRVHSLARAPDIGCRPSPVVCRSRSYALTRSKDPSLPGRAGIRFPSRELRVFREHIKGLLYTAIDRKISFRAAIEAASYIQWSLLKQNVFTTFAEDPKEVRNVLTGLAVASCRRRDRLLEALEETRRIPPQTETPEVEQYTETRDPLLGPDAEYSHLGYYPLDL